MDGFLSLRKMLADLRNKVDEDFANRIENASMKSVDRLETQAIEKLDKIDAVIRMAEAYLPDLVDAELIREIVLTTSDAGSYGEYQHIKAQQR